MTYCEHTYMRAPLIFMGIVGYSNKAKKKYIMLSTTNSNVNKMTICSNNVQVVLQSPSVLEAFFHLKESTKLHANKFNDSTVFSTIDSIIFRFIVLYIIKPSHKSTLSNRYVYMTKQMRILTALGNILSFRSHSLSHCRIYQHLHRAYKGQ